jgi:hypothetical protein
MFCAIRVLGVSYGAAPPELPVLRMFLLILTVLAIYGPPQPTFKTQATTWRG